MLTLEHKKYVIYIVKYLGVALIAGSVVHVGTLRNGTTRYMVLGIIGLFLMVLGNLMEAKHNGEKIDLKYLAVITGLSLATGFLSGGIQHYLDNPVYAGYLLAIGLFFSYVIFLLKDRSKITTKNVAIVAAISIIILVISQYIPTTTSADHHAQTQEQMTASTTSQSPVDNQHNPHSH